MTVTSPPPATLSELPTSETVDVYALFSLPLGSELIASTIRRACELEGLSDRLPDPAVSTYPDMTFHNYHTLGLSLGFSPASTSPFDTTSSQLVLNQIDLFNPPASSIPRLPSSKPTFSPCLPSLLPHPLKRDSTARALILDPLLGEPSRKGGGEPNLGRLGLGVWMEWETDVEEHKGKRVLTVEFEEKGQGCWEKDRLDKARWKEAGLYVVD